MNRRLYDAVAQTSEARALFVLLVVLSLRAWRSIPHLRPVHLLIPLSLAQIILFVITALHPHNFLYTFSAGCFFIALFSLLPITVPRPLKAHWVK